MYLRIILKISFHKKSFYHILGLLGSSENLVYFVKWNFVKNYQIYEG